LRIINELRVVIRLTLRTVALLEDIKWPQKMAIKP